MPSPTDPVTGWIPIRFEDNVPINALRETLYFSLNEPDVYTPEDNPHISLFGFELPRSNLDGFQNDFNTEVANALEGQTTDFDDFHIYPNIENPMVISLDATIDLTMLCDRSIELLKKHNGTVRWGPTPAHVTLLKAGDGGDENTWGALNDPTQNRLEQVLDVSTISFDRTIDTVTLELND